MPGIGPWLLLPLNNPPKVEERGQKLDGPWKVARRDRLQVEGGWRGQVSPEVFKIPQICSSLLAGWPEKPRVKPQMSET